MRIVYRVRQFWYALIAKPNPEHLARASQVLNPAMMSLFLGMDASEQAHSLSIFCQLNDQGEIQEDLLVAALLHDVGKSRYPLRLWERGLIVLGKKLFPNWVEKWGQGEPSGWKRAFVIAEQHPVWGAEMVAHSGASALTTAIIRRHQQILDQAIISSHENSNKEDYLLYKLQVIDNES